MCSQTALILSGSFIIADIRTRCATFDLSSSVNPASSLKALNASSMAVWSTCSLTGTGSKCSGKVALSFTESAKEYRLIYPVLSSVAPNVANVFRSSLLIGVPVRPKKNAFGKAVRILLPRSPSCVL